MKRYLLLLSLIAWSAAHAGQIPTAATACACANSAQLLATAKAYAAKWTMKTPTGYPAGNIVGPKAIFSPGTLIIVVSTTVPISATYRYTQIVQNGAYVVTPTAVRGGSDGDALDYDVQIFARSVKVPTIQLPPTMPDGEPINPSTQPEWIVDSIAAKTGSVLPIAINIVNGFVHGLIYPGQVSQGSFKLNGTVYTIWSNEEVTFRFSNGWTMRVKYNPAVTHGWQLLPDTLRDASGKLINPNGTPKSSPTSSKGGASENIGGNTFPAGSSVGYWPSADSTPGGSITVGEPIAYDGSGGGIGTTPLLSWF